MLYRLSLLLLTCAACLGAVSTPMSSQARPRSTSVSAPLALPILAQASTPTAPPPEPKSASPRQQLPLTLGNQSPQVLELKKTLTFLGYYQGAIDPMYNENTKTAVSKFQSDMGLPPSGIVGKDTWERLNTAQVLKEKLQQPDSPSPSPTVKPSAQPNSTQVQSTQDQEQRRLKGALALLTVSIVGAAIVAGAVLLYERGHSANLVDPDASPSALPKISNPDDDSFLTPVSLSLQTNSEVQTALPSLASPPLQADSFQSDALVNHHLTLETASNGMHKLNTDVGSSGLSAGSTAQTSNAQTSNGYKSFALPAANPPQAETTPALNTVEKLVLREMQLQSEPASADAPPGSLVVSETSSLAKINPGEALLQDLRSADPTKRKKAVWELGQRGNSQAVQPLVDLMLDSDSKQRSLILSSLSEIGVRTLKPMSRALAISLQDDSPDVRKNAIRDLTRVYDLMAQMSQLLRQAADDPDAEVRETARWALGQLGRIRTAPANDSITTSSHSVSSPENFSD